MTSHPNSQHFSVSSLNEAQDITDDWLGVSNPQERRKRQNRLHQRAWRYKRKVALKNNCAASTSWSGKGKLVLVKSDTNNAYNINGNKHTLPRPIDSVPKAQLGINNSASSSNMKILANPAKQPLIPPMLTGLGIEGPRWWLLPNKMTFPLSSDHQLITLIQYNVKRALLANMAILGILDFVHTYKPAALLLPPLPIVAPVTVPISLRPTALQMTVPYDPIIASVPSPAMRDNLIIHAGKYDLETMSSAVYGGLFEGFCDTENRGVMVWGEPWRADSWEMSTGFANKWGFLLENCEDLVNATNRWRMSRGEESLVVEF
ncbi:hypothetical protein BX600DRAFT_477577 [Xylariales sp. PMI_506]|nr:hypothetical protein BX600DRAFT_477577 [Xylariales sp. PMI_506]